MIMKYLKLTLAGIFAFLACSAEEQGGNVTVPPVPDGMVINVSDTPAQKVIFGVDAERLWFWRSESKVALADLAVGELKSQFVRVAINPQYQRESRDIRDESAYDIILEMMTEMKRINPDIEFFASPRPLAEAYNKEEVQTVWDGLDVPWSPYPTWILPVQKSGNQWKTVDVEFNVDNLVLYFADYLNFMYEKGFEITYMDVTQEKEIITPEILVELYEKIPDNLNPGVRMPLLVAPSSWSRYHCAEWLKNIDISDQAQLDALGVIATHNTSDKGTCEDIISVSKDWGKPVWNNELHSWIGVETTEGLSGSILTSDILWEHIRAGFNGIATWLFYGNAAGRPHSMVYVGADGNIARTVKYMIFKTLVNASNGGYYLPVTMPQENIVTCAFKKDNIVSIWILNKTKAMQSMNINLEYNMTEAVEVDGIYWNGQTETSGKGLSVNQGGGNSLHCFLPAESLGMIKVVVYE